MFKNYKISKLIVFSFSLAFAFFSSISQISASSGEDGEKYDVGATIKHHISDAHEWEFAHGVAIPLPVILYTADQGLEIFSFGKFEDVNGEKRYGRYVYDHGKFYYNPNSDHAAHTTYETEEVAEGSIAPVASDDHADAHHGMVKAMDFSITKNVTSMLIAVTLMLIVFLSIAKSYKTRGVDTAPRGVQSFFEPIIMFVRDDIAHQFIGHKAHKFLPYLLTLFFFILFNNLLGLLPAAANVTGNIAVTLVLALLTFIVTNFSGNKAYWGHIFAPPGVPVPLYIIIVPVEIIGLFTKPFSLMIRLFANITAGHIIILSLISIIFIFKSVAMSPISIAFSLFMYALELFVALLQAYIFTMLSAMYIGTAVEDHHHEEAHH